MSNRHHLVLFLGTGPLQKGQTPEAVIRERSYRRAHYVRHDDPARGEQETPFVGEALLRLYPGTFTHVHLFGTADSMWDTLWLHLAGHDAPEADEERYLELHEAVGARALQTGHPWLAALAARFAAAHGVVAHLHVLPIPDGEEATWEMLRRLAALDGLQDGDALSIDVTHGLRIQPLFLLIAARYLTVLLPRLTLRHVFYGALDLHRQGQVPVYDLRAHVEMLDWVEAARSFSRYGDAAPVADLLGDHRAARFSHLSRAVQLNALRDLREDARQLVAAYAQVPPDAPVPFQLMLPALLELPRSLAASTYGWQAKLLLARRHARAQNMGLALLAAWEAVVDRVAAVYHLDDRAGVKVYRALGAIAAGGPPAVRTFFEGRLPTLTTQSRVGLWADWKPARGELTPHFGQVVRTVQMVRNALAHADEGLSGGTEPREVYRLADDGLFDYLQQVLESEAFEGLLQAFPDWKKALPTDA